MVRTPSTSRQLEIVRGEPCVEKVDCYSAGTVVTGFSLTFECTTVGGPVIVENVLVHRPTRSAFVTDFAFGHAPGDPWWFRFYAYLIGMPAGRLAGQSYHRYYHSDRAAVKRGFEKVLGLEWENLLAGHGRPVLGDGKAALRAALADWGMKVDAATML
ncbi:hypothetical protein DFJ74DRAFT_772648 [Hyaloraphidium curvatum]|nr:hypothetical protein DFJ74DRAFT_772648 [Hyaloraphidium curvatum]